MFFIAFWNFLNASFRQRLEPDRAVQDSNPRYLARYARLEVEYLRPLSQLPFGSRNSRKELRLSTFLG